MALNSHVPLHGMLLHLRLLPPENGSGLHREQDAISHLQYDSDGGDAEAPRVVVVLPVGHEVAAVAVHAEDDEGQGAHGGAGQQHHGHGAEHGHAVVVVDAEQVHQQQQDGGQQTAEAEREEQLRRHKEGCEWTCFCFTMILITVSFVK